MTFLEMAKKVTACTDANFARMSKDAMQVWDAMCTAMDPANGQEAVLAMSLLMAGDYIAAGNAMHRATMDELHKRAEEITRIELL